MAWAATCTHYQPIAAFDRQAQCAFQDVKLSHNGTTPGRLSRRCGSTLEDSQLPVQAAQQYGLAATGPRGRHWAKQVYASRCGTLFLRKREQTCPRHGTVGGHGAATVQSMCAPGCSTFLKAKSRCTPHCSTFYFDEVEADLCSHGMALWVTTGSRNGAATAQSRCRPCCSPLIFEEAEAGLPRARHCGWPRGSHGAKHVCMPHGGTLFSMKRKHRHGAPSTAARPILPGQGSGRFQK